MSFDALQIRRMTQDDVSIAVDWARQEGWNPGLRDAQCFFQCDPNGFFVGELNGAGSARERAAFRNAVLS
jgi:hypothetical protein